MDAPSSPQGPDDDLARYVGLEAAEAEHRARARGWSTLRRLMPGAMVTLEYLEGRLNFEVDKGKVRRAWQG